MTDFLLELRSEEIPARMQAGARADLERLFRKEMEAAGVALGQVTVWSTPRRLALIAGDLPETTEAVSEETKGPATSAPEQALEGFLRKTGLTKDQLEVRDLKGKDTYFAVVEKPGRPVRDVLAEAIPAMVRAFPWPKSQRWGARSISTESLRWVRPLSGIVAIFGEDLVECEVDGIRSGYATKGHRFHHPDEITIGSAHDYADKLRACHVIVDHEERQDLIRAKAREAAAEAGLMLVEDEGLVIENAGLTEWPAPLLGRFDEAFLEVPPEVIQLTARVNQKYFVCTVPPQDGEGDRAQRGGGAQAAKPDLPASANPPVPLHRPADGPPPRAGEERLANAFVCTANIVAHDGGEAIVAGNRKVLAARLSDARFFWEQDRKTPLSQHAKKLERITFHEKLGTVADKVERVAKLARWLVEEGVVPPRNGEGDHAKRGGGAKAVDATPDGQENSPVPLHRPADGPPPRAGEDLSLADQAELAARLCKADLVTEMVGEFPELQGVMGGYYARAEGLPDTVADAIRDHYKPVGQGDEVPTAPVTVAVSLADKLDTVLGFFFISEMPTGSKDPFALRRAVLAIIRQIASTKLRANIEPIVEIWTKILGRTILDRMIVETRRVAAKNSANEQLQREAREAESAGDIGRALLLIKAVEVVEFDPVVDAVATGYIEYKEGRLLLKRIVLDFFADRLKVQQREAGVRHDLIDAVFALGGEDDLVRLLARVRALQAFVETEDGTNLLAGYKRAANILRKEDWRGVEGEISRTGEEDPLALVDDPDLAPVIAAKMADRHAAEKTLSYTPENAEKALIDALDSAEPQAAEAVGNEDFSGAMAALASLRKPIDSFFDEVTVNDSDPIKRTARLALLDRFRAAVHNVADFSRIEG